MSVKRSEIHVTKFYLIIKFLNVTILYNSFIENLLNFGGYVVIDINEIFFLS